jgi:hypothetical protein
MTNRESFLKKLSEMTNEQLAYAFCRITSCMDCPARIDCVDLSGIEETLVEWLTQERETKGC